MVKEFENAIEEDIAQGSAKESERQGEFASKDVSYRKSCSNRSVNKQFSPMIKKNGIVFHGNMTM